ncbi:MAG: hypothetical protein AAGF23_21760 [Acidobacteriota bacterium]
MTSPLYAPATRAAATETRTAAGSPSSRPRSVGPGRSFEAGGAATSASHRLSQVSFARPGGGTGGVVQRCKHKKQRNFMDAMAGLFGSKTGPLPQGPRSDLDTHLRQYDRPEPFTGAVDFVNKGLGVNTDAPLPEDKAKKYMHDTAAVQSGDMSNSYAFGSSAYDWMKRGNFTAAFMNLGGMMAAGAYDHQKMKRGY